MASVNREMNQEKTKPIYELTRDLDAMVDNNKQDFESFDPAKQRATYQMVLDAQWSMTRLERDFNQYKEMLKTAGNSEGTRPLYEMIYAMFFKKINGEFTEPWMENAAKELKPCWETDL